MGFFSGEKLRKLDPTTGAVEILADAAIARGGAWGPDGTIVYYSFASGGLDRVQAGGGEPRPAVSLDRETGENELRFPAFLPDGSRRDGRAGSRARPRSPTTTPAPLAPDRTLMSVAVDPEADTFTWSAPRPLFETAIVDLGPRTGTWSYDVAPDGERFLVLSRRAQTGAPAVAWIDWVAAIER